MPSSNLRNLDALRAVALSSLMLGLGCASQGAAVPGQWDAKLQIYQSEASQVQVRNAQSRVYDTTDKLKMLEAIVATYQDLGFRLEVVDEELGLIAGKKFLDITNPRGVELLTYRAYNEDSLIMFNSAFRNWGPFMRRADLVRLTTTVRSRNEKQLIVRTSAQFYLRPVESPDAYRAFYAALEKALFAEQDAAASGAAGS